LSEAGPRFKVTAIAAVVDGQVEGDGSIEVHDVDALDRAGPGCLSFIRAARYQNRWADSGASAAIVGPDVTIEPGEGRAFIRVADADLAIANLLDRFAPPTPKPDVGFHPSSVVDPTATVAGTARVGPLCVVHAGATVGEHVVLHDHVTVGPGVTIGEACELWPGVVLRDGTRLGARVRIHPGAVLGADGFGYRPAADGASLTKIPQIGTVEVGDDAEIGANTCIDRGVFSATRIGRGAKIDNLVQIGHNCEVGEHTVIAGHVGLAGSVKVGAWVQIGGGAGVRDGVTIGDRARIAAASGVGEDVPAGESWAGYPAENSRSAYRAWKSMRKLPEVVKEWREFKQRHEAASASDTSAPAPRRSPADGAAPRAESS